MDPEVDLCPDRAESDSASFELVHDDTEEVSGPAHEEGAEGEPASRAGDSGKSLSPGDMRAWSDEASDEDLASADAGVKRPAERAGAKRKTTVEPEGSLSRQPAPKRSRSATRQRERATIRKIKRSLPVVPA